MIELVEQGSGILKYLVVEPDQHNGPWVAGNIHELLEDVNDADAAVVHLIMPDGQTVPVHVENTDDNNLDWEITLADGGELIERIEYSDEGETSRDYDSYTLHVHGFQLAGSR